MANENQYYLDEKAKWDGLMRAKYGANPEKLVLGSDQNIYTYLKSDSVARAYPGISDFLGEVKGKKLLEYGCGSGYTAALLAKSGAEVTAFDISDQSVATTNLRAELNHLDNLKAEVAVGEKLPYSDHSFDLVFGRAVLHHLDVDTAAPELYRVLKPGGKALFIEPMGMNPVLNFVRDYVPYPNKNPVGDDSPLNYKEIKKWGEKFSQYDYHEVHLLGMLERAFPYKWNVRLPILHKVDRTLLTYVTPLKRLSRYIIMEMVK